MSGMKDPHDILFSTHKQKDDCADMQIDKQYDN